MKAFIISLSKIESSNISSKQVLEKLIKYGFDASLFEGTYGNDAVKLFESENRKIARYGIKSETITRIDFENRYPHITLPYEVASINLRKELIETGKILRPGVLGCFYSHYRLWEHCVELNEPIFIFEDDVIFERNYIPVKWKEVLLLCTGKSAHKHPFYEKFLYNPPPEPGTVKLYNTSMPGSVGYGLTPKGAKKLVDAYSVEMLPSDTAMNMSVVHLECHTHLMGRAATDNDGKVSLTKSKIWKEMK